MKSIYIFVIAGIVPTAPPVARAQVIGSAVIGISVAEIAPAKTASCAIINAGGFSGLAKHDVAMAAVKVASRAGLLFG